MGRIKTALVKRTGKGLLDATHDIFSSDFGHNKKVIGSTMPSKRLRNRIAGYVTRIKKNTHKIIDEGESSKEDNREDI